MTDREILKAMIKRAQTRGLKQAIHNEGHKDSERTSEVKYHKDGTITVFGGYQDFYTTFTFNEDGSLEGIRAWE